MLTWIWILMHWFVRIDVRSCWEQFRHIRLLSAMEDQPYENVSWIFPRHNQCAYYTITHLQPHHIQNLQHSRYKLPNSAISINRSFVQLPGWNFLFFVAKQQFLYFKLWIGWNHVTSHRWRRWRLQHVPGCSAKIFKRPQFWWEKSPNNWVFLLLVFFSIALATRQPDLQLFEVWSVQEGLRTLSTLIPN